MKWFRRLSPPAEGLQPVQVAAALGLSVAAVVGRAEAGQLEGYEIYDGDPPPVIPDIVSRVQAKLAMAVTPHGAGTLLEAVEALIAGWPAEGLPGGEILRLWWREVSHLHRDHALVEMLRQQLGLTTAQRDGLFVLAASFR